MRLFVGNLSHDSTEDSIRQAFSAYGTVGEVKMMTDRDTGRPRGFGFVDMSADTEAQAAIDGLNGAELDGRAVNVNEAHARPERSDGGGRGRGGSGQRW